MVSDAHAIVNPGTVMVEAFNTVATYGAVPAATRSYRAAVRTQLCTVNVLKHVQEVNFAILEVAGLGARGSEEKDEADHGDHEVKKDGPSAQIYTQVSH